MGQIRAFCDPDKPLDPSEWGKLGIEEVFSLEKTGEDEEHDDTDGSEETDELDDRDSSQAEQ